jgi:hypothetical protein
MAQADASRQYAEEWQNALANNRELLVDVLRLDTSFMVLLVQRRVITAEFKEELEGPGVPGQAMTRRKKNSELIEHLLRQNESVFEVFCEILRHRDVNRPDLANRLQDFEIIDVDGQELTDSKGPIQRTLSSFYEANKGKAYPMFMESRGSVLIINAKTFEKRTEKDRERKGTDKDRDDLKRLFTDLHFGNIRVCNDDAGLTAEGIKEQVKSFARSIPESAQACIVCVMSHGVNGYILGTDEGKVNIKESILKPITELPHLKGKPKMFIFQACRVDQPDGQIDLEDVIECYPVKEGRESWRHKTKGSYFIQAIVRVFRRHAHDTDVKDMFEKVNEINSKKNGESEMKHWLTKDFFFFFPGIIRNEF